MTSSRLDLMDRASGSLWGLAIGDALGMPTQLLSRRQVVERYGVIDGLREPAPDHPVAAGLPAGSVTDDTQQALLLAAQLGPGGRINEQRWVQALLDWQDEARRRGSLDLLGPSTRAALEAVRSGAPLATSGSTGTTNGAAMRIAPLGIAVDAADLDRLVGRVVAASRITHDTSVALAGAAAVAAAVSAALDGARLPAVVDRAVQAAELADEQAAARSRWVAGASVARRIEWAVDAVTRLSNSEQVAEFVVDLVGTSLATQESVPAAFACVAAFPAAPWQAVCFAAGLGGDADTIAAMSGAVAGALHGRDAWPADVVRRVADVNRPDFDGVGQRLLSIRSGS